MISKALSCWEELQPYRSERRRCKNYTYGDQWKDIVTASDGRQITEEQYIREQGSAPLKNNLIRKIVRNVLGVFRTNYSLPEFEDIDLSFLKGISPGFPDEQEIFQANLKERFHAASRTNSMSEIYSRVLEEYLIGGMAIIRKRFSLEGGGMVFTDIVKPDGFFFNTDASDPRGWDIDFIGEVHSVAPRDSYGIFSRRRIFEIWQKDAGGWTYSFCDENGAFIKKGRSPFPSGGHPYVMKAYPYIDGEIHSFVADCIDQQRYINRLITLNDWIIRASAKGVLLMPESAIPDDLDLEDIADQWSRYNGVIRYKAKAGIPVPQQVSTNSTNVGITDLLEVQLKMMEDVSGINAALQGQISSGNISGTLYEQQTRHALTGLTDILEGFRCFMLDSAAKDVAMLSLA